METIRRIIKERILVLDGAMGTMVQGYSLNENDFRADRFRNHPFDLKGNNDILTLTRPEVISEIHRRYLASGADIIETNTFCANAINQREYGTERVVGELNRTAAGIARTVADEFTRKNPAKPRFIAGSIGPTNKTASLSPRVEDPAYRDYDFDRFVAIYAEQIDALIEGGVDMLLIETVIDTLVCKAAIVAAIDCFRKREISLPMMISASIADESGRILSGQTIEAFMTSVAHFPLFAIGLNCSFGAAKLKPQLDSLARLAPMAVLVYPNAGLPNEMGTFDQNPDGMAAEVRIFLEEGLVNIVGGCCGTTPDHIAALSDLAKNYSPRHIPGGRVKHRFCGLEPLVVFPGSNFINIGERTNITGSRKFARAIKEGRYDQALTIARNQVEGGAQILDVNLDDSMLDGRKEMTVFLRWLNAEPDIAKLPIMVDSSQFSVCLDGLKCLQGKSIVNSISLKEGEQVFLERASTIRQFGAAVVVMAFDENGQADSYRRRIEIAERAYRLLTEKIGFPAEDIIIDPNVMALGTGMSGHRHYALDFIEATKWIKANLPQVMVSGGISNISFSFRGNDRIREAIHAVFLYHAVGAGLDMGIVNAGMVKVYDQIEPELLELVEDLVLDRRDDATDRLIGYGEKMGADTRSDGTEAPEWRNGSLDARLSYALVNGLDEYIIVDVEDALKVYEKPLKIIEGPLMGGMSKVGDLFGSGKMFLPQVVKSARVMKKAVGRILPLLGDDETGSKPLDRGTFVIATVKGDVHDIGKDIVGVVLKCNNYKVIDLGVMVPKERIIEAATLHQACAIGLSGLITPSLDEMIDVARTLDKSGMAIPLLIGGATTSLLHTAVKIAPNYRHSIVYVPDASKAVTVLNSLLGESRGKYCQDIHTEYTAIRNRYREGGGPKLIDFKTACSKRLTIDWEQAETTEPKRPGLSIFDEIPIATLRKYIDWTPFFWVFQLRGKYPAILDHPERGDAARKLFEETNRILGEVEVGSLLKVRAAVGLYPAQIDESDRIVVYDLDRRTVKTVIPTLRQQVLKEEGRNYLSLADFLPTQKSGCFDYLGMFADSAGFGLEQAIERYGDDPLAALILKALADRLAEAAAEYLHLIVRKELWGYAADERWSLEELISCKYKGIRPAPGYPTCPDHLMKRWIFEALEAERRIGITLTSSAMMIPAASVAGFYFVHPEAKYFDIKKIGKDQCVAYAKALGESEAMVARNLANLFK